VSGTITTFGAVKSRAKPWARVAEELERVWADFANQANFWLSEEVEESDPIYEGTLRRIYVNAYERNPDARRKCIAHYGASCMACGFDFVRLNGNVGRNFIHVHHLRQLALIGKEYQIDPISDLRPGCPNCHAIIHRRKEAYTIEEVQALMRQAKREKRA
jgi:5-methylcytosine-specific restriction enzyme A